MWIKDINGDLVRLEHILRLTVSGAGSEWYVNYQSIVQAFGGQISGGHATKEDAQAAALALVSEVRN